MPNKNIMIRRLAKFALSLATCMTCFSINPTYAEETSAPTATPAAIEASPTPTAETSTEPTAEATASPDAQPTVTPEDSLVEVEEGKNIDENGNTLVNVDGADNEIPPMIQPTIDDTVEPNNSLDFSSCRLLVAGDDSVETDSHVMSSYNGLYLLQYETEKETRTAYYDFLNTAAFVDIDTTVMAANDESDSDTSDITITEDQNPLTEAKDESSIDVPTENSRERPLIYLIDSGISQDRHAVSSMSVLGDDPTDDNGHGTKMYDLIREQDPNASIVSIKALDASGRGTISSVAAAMRYAIDNHADIINLSLSAPATSENSALLSLITEAHDAGIAVVGAAGNGGKNVKYFVPGSSSDAIIVSACDQNGVLLSTSNYGDTVYASVEAESTSEAAAIMTGLLSINCRERGRFFEWDERPSIVHYPAEPHGDMSGCSFTDGLFDAAACPYVHNWSNESIIVTDKNEITDAGKELFNTRTINYVPYNNTEMSFNGSGTLYIYASDGKTVKQSWTMTDNSGSAVQHSRVNDSGGNMTIWIPNAGTYQGKQFAISLKVTLASSNGFVSGQVVPGLLELSVGARAGKTDLIDIYVENGSLYKLEETFYTGNITSELNSGTILQVAEGNHMLFGALNASNENRSDNSWAQNIEFIGGKKGSTIYVQNYEQNVATTNDSNQTHVNDSDFYAIYPYDCAAHNDISVSALFDQKDENGAVPLTLTSYVGNMGLWNGGYSWSGWGRTYLHGQDSTIWFQCYTRPFYGAPSELTPSKQVLDDDGNDMEGQKVQGGDTLDYAISVTNNSATNEYTIAVSDPLPLDVDVDTDRGAYHGSDAEFTYDANARTVSWSSTKLAPGETKTYHLYAMVVDFPETESIDNTAQVNVKLKSWTYNEPTNTVHNPPSKEKFHGFFIHWLALNDANGDGIEDTPDDYSDNKVLARMYADKNLGKGEAYNVTAPDLNAAGYRVVDNQIVDDQCTITRDNSVVSGVMPADVYELYVYYVPHSLTINYRETGTNTILWSTHKDITLGKGDAYSVESPVIGGYAINKSSDKTVSGIMPSDIYEYDVYYTRDAMIGSQVSVTKSSLPLSGDFVAPGDTITYTLTVRNTGVNTGTKIKVSDAVPVGVTYVSAANGGAYNQNTSTVEWSLSSLAAGAESKLSWTAKVNAEFNDVVYNVGHWTYAEDPADHETNLTVHPVSRDLAPDIEGNQIGPAALNITKGQNDAITDREFNYTGNVQIFDVQMSGTYKIVCYGASGGDDAKPHGKGGMISGEIYLNEGQRLYIYVGGHGLSNATSSGGGYNGGGNAGASGWSGGGGGATDVRTSTDINTRLICAGGGGGGGATGAGDAGGTGGNSGSPYGQSGGADGGGGGGGWNGGATRGEGGGYGGASRCTNEFFNVTQQAGVREGDGYARITLIANPSSTDTTSSSSSPTSTVSASSVVTYKIFARNDGTETAHNVVLVDPIPTGTTLVSPGDGVYNKTLNRVEWVITNMPPGAYVSKEFIVAVTDNMDKVPPIIANQVDYARDIDPNTIDTVQNLKNKTNIVEYKTGGKMSVLIVNTILDDPAYEDDGHNFTYVITGPNGSSQTVAIPHGNTSNTFRIEGLANGSYTITQQADSVYELYNGSADKNSSFNKSTWVGSFTFSSSIREVELTFFDKIENPFVNGNRPKKQVVNAKGDDINEQFVSDGATLTYIISFYNPTHATKVFDIEDDLPEHTTFISADNGGVNNNGTVMWSKISVASGDTGRVSMKVKAGAEQGGITTIKNIAKVYVLNAAGGHIPNIDPYTNEVVNYVMPPVLNKSTMYKSVTLTEDPNSEDMDTLYIKKDDMIYYHIQIKGLPIQANAVLTDVIPDGLEYVSGTADHGGTYNSANRTMTWNLSIAAKSAVTVTFGVKAVVDSGDFNNHAVLAIDEGVSESNHVSNEAALITINKTIENYYEPFGEPSFGYKITGSNGSVNYRMIPIVNPKAEATGTATFAVPTGTAADVTWTVEEMSNARYALKSVSSSSTNTVKNGDQMTVTPAAGNRASVIDCANAINDWSEYSHEDSALNHIKSADRNS